MNKQGEWTEHKGKFMFHFLISISNNNNYHLNVSPVFLYQQRKIVYFVIDVTKFFTKNFARRTSLSYLVALIDNHLVVNTSFSE